MQDQKSQNLFTSRIVFYFLFFGINLRILIFLGINALRLYKTMSLLYTYYLLTVFLRMWSPYVFTKGTRFIFIYIYEDISIVWFIC